MTIINEKKFYNDRLNKLDTIINSLQIKTLENLLFITPKEKIDLFFEKIDYYLLIDWALSKGCKNNLFEEKKVFVDYLKQYFNL